MVQQQLVQLKKKKVAAFMAICLEENIEKRKIQKSVSVDDTYREM